MDWITQKKKRKKKKTTEIQEILRNQIHTFNQFENLVLKNVKVAFQTRIVSNPLILLFW